MTSLFCTVYALKKILAYLFLRYKLMSISNSYINDVFKHLRFFVYCDNKTLFQVTYFFSKKNMLVLKYI